MKKKSRSNLKIIFPVILILSISLSIIILVRGQRLVDTTEQNVRNLKIDIENKERVNLDLHEKIDKMDTASYIEKVARDELMMARPGETIYIFVEPETPE